MKTWGILIRIGLFAAILVVGTAGAMAAGETVGLALVGLSGASVQTLASNGDGEPVYVGVVGGPQPAGIYRSDDNGLTWNSVSAGPSTAVNALAVHPSQEGVLYAGTSGGPATTTDSLWYSVNNGRSWKKFGLGLPVNPEGQVPGVNVLAVDASQPDVLYVGTDGQGVYRIDLTNNGYQLIGGVTLYDAHVKSLVIGGDSSVFVLTERGLFVEDDGFWRKVESVPELPNVVAVAATDPHVLYIGGTSIGVYRSDDGGKTWQPVNNELSMLRGAALQISALAVDVKNAYHVVAATTYGVGGRLVSGSLYESFDGGVNWSELSQPEGVVSHISIEQDVVYAASDAGLVRYGQPERTSVPVLSLVRQSLASSLSVTQRVILLLTLVLSGIALLGRTEWLSRQRRVIA